MKKRWIVSVLIGAMLLSSLAGCGSQETAETTAAAVTTAAAQSVAQETVAETEPAEGETRAAAQAEAVSTGTYKRHPLYLAADKLKNAFHQMGFAFADNGESAETETADTTFATWEEPEELFGWASDPVLLGEGQTAALRTRLLPAQLKAWEGELPMSLLAFGRVFANTDEESYRRTQIEGMVVDESLDADTWADFWNQYAVVFFGLDASAQLDSVGTESYQITIQNADGSQKYELGCTGPASAEAMKTVGADTETYNGWVFVLDVDGFAVQYLGLNDKTELYSCDLEFLNQFESGEAAAGLTMPYRSIDLLRTMGYVEICGDTIYEDGTYLKMNMIQDEWDTNNQPVQTAEPIGDLTGLRTVMVPPLEEALAENYAAGAESVRVFEVGHQYSPVEGQDLPAERVALTMMAYGPDVTLESFTEDVDKIMQLFGVTSYSLTTVDHAIAYKDCQVIINSANPTASPGNFGQINPIATENYGIGTVAYMANLEFTAE